MELTLNGQAVKPLQTVSFYTCGMTPCGPTHLGHARLFVVCDAIKRVLSGLLHCTVLDGINVTDVDDKIIQRAAASGQTIREFADRAIARHEAALRSLNVRPENRTVRVTDCIPDIIAFVERLVDQGKAERTEDGVRMTAPPSFSLWKSRPTEEAGWQSPWGWGRPGWHVECSTITSVLFGGSLDFHAGGADLATPHHENESAQNRAYFGQDSVRAFVHVGSLQVQGAKMSKSLDNAETVEHFLTGDSPEALRMIFLMTKWKTPLAYTQELLQQARSCWNLLHSFVRLPAAPCKQGDYLPRPDLGSLKSTVLTALCTEVDTATAIQALCALTHQARSGAVPFRPAQVFVQQVLALLGFRSDACQPRAPPAVLDVRQRLRQLAMRADDGGLRGELFALTDRMRLAFACEDP